jgi:hypothetical protein
MRQSLKHILSQHLQAMEHDYKCLDLSVRPWNEMQIHSLETLRTSLRRLRDTVNKTAVSESPISVALRQDIYNQLAIIGGFVQILLDRQVGEVGFAATTSLEKILNEGRNMKDALEADKAQIPPSTEVAVPRYNWALASNKS